MTSWENTFSPHISIKTNGKGPHDIVSEPSCPEYRGAQRVPKLFARQEKCEQRRTKANIVKQPKKYEKGGNAVAGHSSMDKHGGIQGRDALISSGQ